MFRTLCVCIILYIFDVLASAEPTLSVLESRIIELEKRDQQLIQIIKDQASKIDYLTDTVQNLNDQNMEQRIIIKDIQTELETYKTTVNKPNVKQPSGPNLNENATFDQVGETIDHKGRNQSDSTPAVQSERARKFILNGVDTVAFHANFPDNAHVVHHAVGTPIEFSNVLLNLGGGYNSSTSLFIAPMPGLYIFSVSIMSSLTGVGHSVHAGIMKNGHYLAGAYANKGSTTDAEQGSVSIVTELVVGDKVFVKHYVHNDGTIYGGGLTSFMGCLIFPL